MRRLCIYGSGKYMGRTRGAYLRSATSFNDISRTAVVYFERSRYSSRPLSVPNRTCLATLSLQRPNGSPCFAYAVTTHAAIPQSASLGEYQLKSESKHQHPNRSLFPDVFFYYPHENPSPVQHRERGYPDSKLLKWPEGQQRAPKGLVKVSPLKESSQRKCLVNSRAWCARGGIRRSAGSPGLAKDICMKPDSRRSRRTSIMRAPTSWSSGS